MNQSENTINAYVCEDLHIIITKDVEIGVSPALIKCPICDKASKSQFYIVNQSLIPTHEFRKPKEGEIIDSKLEQHVIKGGLLLYPIKSQLPKLERPLVFIDFETTGLDIVNDQIIQIGIVKLHPDGEITHLDMLVQPTISNVSEESFEIHGISDDSLKNEKTFLEISEKLNEYLSGCDIAGYNIIKFDIPLLVEEFNRANIKFDISDRKIIDIFLWYKKYRSQSLIGAYKEFFNKEFDDTHNALGDSIATHKVFEAMLNLRLGIGNNVKEWESFNWDRSKMVDLAGKFIRNDKGEIVFNFGSERGIPIHQKHSILNWMVGKNFTSDTMKWVHDLMDNPSLSYAVESK